MAFQKKEPEERVEFETIKSFEQRYGTKNFIEVALKRTVGKEEKFLSVSKGYYDVNGNKIYKKSFGFAESEEMRKFLVESFGKLTE